VKKKKSYKKPNTKTKETLNAPFSCFIIYGQITNDLDKEINLELLHLFRKPHTIYQKYWVSHSQVISIRVLITDSNDINIYTISSYTVAVAYPH
jgi:hypothetical protein